MSEALRQRQPRVEDPGHLARIRRKPCIVCRRPGPSDAAHIRAASPFHNKRYTGKGERPSDCWTLPLCRDHHCEQHSMNELAFWRQYGINPFVEAKRLYGDRVPKRPRPKLRQRKAARKSRPISSRGFDTSKKRPFTSRNSLRNEA